MKTHSRHPVFFEFIGMLTVAFILAGIAVLPMAIYTSIPALIASAALGLLFIVLAHIV